MKLLLGDLMSSNFLSLLMFRLLLKPGRFKFMNRCYISLSIYSPLDNFNKLKKVIIKYIFSYILS